MRLSRFALAVGALGALGSLLLIACTPFLAWKVLATDSMKYTLYAHGGVNIAAFLLAVLGLCDERDKAAGKIVALCFVLLLLATFAWFVTAMMGAIKHPV